MTGEADGPGPIPANRPIPPTQLFVSRQPETLCRLCKLVIQPAAVIKHRTYLDLKISAGRGCPLCQFWFHTVSAHVMRGGTEKLSRQLHISRVGDELVMIDYTSTSMRFELFSVANKSVPTKNETVLGTMAPNTARIEAPGGVYNAGLFRETASDPQSDESWDLINGWVNDCAEVHGNCRREGAEPPPLPNRVLDVSSETPFLKVVENGERGRFVALSHSWGIARILCTTMSTFAQFQEGIDIRTIGVTFQNAIHVTRKLKIKYLWIDSLCIIQDSAEDWAREAAYMGQYYKNAFLNLSALNDRGSQGFLNLRAPEVTADLGNGLKVRRSRPAWREVFQTAPLSTRAWVLQERLMSTRVLHFGEDELFWECLLFSARESTTEASCLSGQHIRWEDENFKRSLHFTDEDTETIMRRWYPVISQYSNLHLTYRSDIFPALSGIAQAFHLATDFTYYAGIWLEHIHSGLLWYRHCLDKTNAPNHDVWIAPTWSWGSASGPVSQIYGDTIDKPESALRATVLRVEAIVATHDPFGRLSGAWVLLNSHCADVWYKGSNGRPPFNDPYLALVLEIYDSGGVQIGTGYLDYLSDSASGVLAHAQAVVISQRADLDNDGSMITYFLLCVPLGHDGASGIEYRRIGIGQTVDPYYGTINDRFPAADCVRKDIKIF